MDTAQWPQDLGLVTPMEELVSSSSASTVFGSSAAVGGGGGGSSSLTQPLMGGERRARPQKEQALNCPRCNSTNTKFCYYNNYSLTQPRYFCKTCRRYWTEGGSLRNVPVGGGSRKNKRPSSSSSSSPAMATTLSATAPSTIASASSTLTAGVAVSSSAATKKLLVDQNPKFHEGHDLNLAFALPEFGDAHGYPGAGTSIDTSTANPASASGAISAMELLRSTGIQPRGMSPFVPMHAMTMPDYPMGFGVQDFRPNSGLSFPLDVMNGGGGSGSGGYGAGMQETSGRLLFPFEESRPVSSSGGAGEHQYEQGRGQGTGGDPTPGFWNGMMGGGAGGGSSW